uniref:Bromo domain-containing protein n=1 Tax=Oryza glumipatula TaxID=40148 RepID=A0A0E0AXI3_9ORYZ
MTARSGDPGVSPESSSAAAAAAAAGSGGGEIWGTSEDLLLACAVSRHGTASWDAVAKEMQSRCPSAAVFTPATCRLRFRVLHRRFSGGVTAENEDADGGEEEEEPDAAAVAGWVEELRELRVAELRREVEKYDLSIGSLQSKVKRLKEEREKSISGETKPPPPPAAVKEEEEDVRKGSPEEAGAVEDRVSGHESGRSCKESNSSDLKRSENDPAVADDDREEEEEEEAAAAPAAGEVAVKEEASGESVAGSKEADAEKESSDVQSSASPSRRRRRKGGGGGGEEAEAASPSVSVPLPAAEAEPLVAFLESVRTSKAGAVFERRLDSQDGERYSGTIRRHVDLETVRSRLVGATAAAACYASTSEFYRDMMLLCANALVFFPRGSPEHAAALQLRALVSKQVSKDRQPHAGAKAPAAAAAEEEKKKPAKADADIAGPLLEKAPIIVCRKRSSIAKAAAAAAKGEKAETDKKEKDGSEEKKAAAAATTATAAATAKDKKARGMRTNMSRGPARNQKTAKLSETGEGTKKSDKKGGGGGGSSSAAAAAGGVAKKRNAVDFLNRMNQNGSPSTERVSLLETLKLSAAATEQQKKSSSSSSGKGDGRKEAGGSGSKKGAAASTPPGRRIGRPPKRAAAPPTPPPSKRAKDDKPTRKRGKK